MENNLNLIQVLRKLYKWRRPIILLSGGTFVLTAGLSLLLPNFFEAKTVFYAASEDQAKPEVLFPEKGSNITAEYYGSESDIDRLLTVAQSNELKDYLIDSFALFAHYDKNPDAPKARYRLRKKLDKHYDIQKNERDALILSFEDKDPAFAARIANAAREKIEQITLGLIRSNQAKNLKANRENIQRQERNQRMLADSLDRLRAAYGLYDGLEQTQELSTEITSKQSLLTAKEARYDALKGEPSIPRDTLTYLQAEVKGLEANVRSLEDKLDLWRKGMSAVLDMEKQYLDGAQRLSEDRARTRVLQATYEADIPAVLVVEEAEVPLYKSRPSRSILVLAATLVVFVFTVLGILLFEAYKDLNWKAVTDG